VPPGTVEKGLASWYGHPYHGRRTACGEIYDMHRLTAAHPSLPFQTRVRVRRRDTGAAVDVRINDRGPFVKGRIIDLSYAAACRIGLDVDGVAPVTVEVLSGGQRAEPPPQLPPPAAAAPQEEPAPSPAAQPAPLPPPPEEERCWWVQVGAFSDEGNADRAVARLRSAGEAPVVMVSPGGLSRVRVGPVGAEDEARAIRARLLSDWPAAQVVACGD